MYKKLTLLKTSYRVGVDVPPFGENGFSKVFDVGKVTVVRQA